MPIKKRLIIKTKRALRHMTPRHIIKTRLTEGVIKHFAERVGLVYFGYVNQKDDEHRLVRGHTVSATHQDNHYCVGSFRGYDVMVVLRNDVVLIDKGHKEQRCHWLIYTVDLHTKQDLPHVYIGHRSRDAAFAASYAQQTPLYIGNYAAYPPQYTSNYTAYGRPTDALKIEQLISPKIADVIASQFKSASIEIEDNTLYLYIESERPNEALLESMLSNCLWLGAAIDAQYAPAPTED